MAEISLTSRIYIRGSMQLRNKRAQGALHVLLGKIESMELTRKEEGKMVKTNKERQYNK